MRKTTPLLVLPLILLGAGACTSHYAITGMERTRILIDKRFDATEDSSAKAFLAPYKKKVDSLMMPVVGQAACNMSAGRPESKLSNLLTDILVWGGKQFGEKPDFAVYNIGGMRASLTKGDITVGDVLNVAPFENKICFVSLTGEEVLQLFRQIAHRGGEGVSHSVRMRITADGQLGNATIDGQPIDPKVQYRIATIDYVVQGNDGMTAFTKGTDLVSPQTEENNLRYFIMNYFRECMKEGVPVCGEIEGRITME